MLYSFTHMLTVSIKGLMTVKSLPESIDDFLRIPRTLQDETNRQTDRQTE